MRPDDAARLIGEQVSVPWDEFRAARGQKRVLGGLRKRPPQPRRARSPLVWVAAAAVLIGLVGLLRFSFRPNSPQAGLEFGDGSSVLPDAHTRVVPELVAADKIQVRQSGGSATYEVTPHPHRSFVVRVKEVRVEVIGTAFRIDDLEAAVRVTVQRGRVRVTRGARTVILGAGESLLLRDRDDEVAVHAASSGASPLASDSIPLLDLTDAAATEPPETSAAELFRSADDARAAGNSVEALRLLKLLVQQHPLDRRVTLARFTMGRIEAQRDNFAEAARAFESCGNALSGEALAEAALARAAAGQASEAKAHAKHYREQFPGGPRYRELAKLAE